MERDEWGRRWREVEGVLPKIDISRSSSGRRGESMEKLLNDEKRWGVWPGDTELMTVERGVILAAVTVKEKKEGSLLFPWMQESKVQEMVVVGKWSATPLPLE